MQCGTLLWVLATLLLRLVASESSAEFLQRHQEARGADGLAPLYGTEDPSRFPDVYIVILHDDYTLQQHLSSIGMDLSNNPSFRSCTDGYRAKLDDNILNLHVRMDPGVLFVDTDGPLVFRGPSETSNEFVDAEMQRRYTTEVDNTQAPYGLQMVSSHGKLRTPVMDGGRYQHVQGAGRGVNVYVFDSGIRTSHTQFGGRATHFGGGASSDRSRYTNETNDDRTGHGTHVAGIVGAKTYGVAPNANIISVKVTGAGAEQWRLAQALQDVTAEHRANRALDQRGAPWTFRGSVINMSFGWYANEVRELVRKRIIEAIEEGIPVFVSAGNDEVDVDELPWYPCSFPETVCIGAVDYQYWFASDISNYGRPVTYLAPGIRVLSLGIQSDMALAIKSGTSMACPHAAGAAAIFTSWRGLLNNQAPAYVKANSLDNLISGVPYGTGTRLINTGIQSPKKKWWKEPFVFAGEYPAGNHNQHDITHDELKAPVTAADVSSAASATPLSGIDIGSYTTMQTITVSEVTGLTTEAVVATSESSFPEETPSIPVPTETATPAPPAGGETGGQQIALALNISQHADLDLNGWKRLIRYDSNKISVLLADIQNDDFASADDDWKHIINAGNSTGKRVIGRVDTGYLGASERLLATRLGSIDIADWAAQIENDVDAWFRLYGGEHGLGGIFFDRAWSDCGPDNMYSDMYAYINAYTKRKYPGAFTVLNTGLDASQCLEHTMDSLVTFTGTYDTYKTSYTQLDWTPADSRKIWHIIRGVSASDIDTVVTLAAQRGAGLVQVTSDTLDQPFASDAIPEDAYMQAFMKVVQGGNAPVANAPTAADGPAAEIPGSLVVDACGYTSISLSWEPSANAFGYNVYFHDTQVLSLPSYITYATVGDIPSNSSNLSFSVRAIGGGNIESGSSESVSASTLALPGSRPIINLKAEPQDGWTTYSADILLPYSSVTVFITYTNPNGTCDLEDVTSWPICYDPSHCYCSVAMIQGDNLYRYNGTTSDTAIGGLPWAWALEGAVAVTRTGYTYSWVAPIGTSMMDTTSFVVQAQGHAHAAYAFSPCPKDREWSGPDIFCA